MTYRKVKRNLRAALLHVGEETCLVARRESVRQRRGRDG
jgi:hypothetical protein